MIKCTKGQWQNIVPPIHTYNLLLLWCIEEKRSYINEQTTYHGTQTKVHTKSTRRNVYKWYPEYEQWWFSGYELLHLRKYIWRKLLYPLLICLVSLCPQIWLAYFLLNSLLTENEKLPIKKGAVFFTQLLSSIRLIPVFINFFSLL